MVRLIIELCQHEISDVDITPTRRCTYDASTSAILLGHKLCNHLRFQQAIKVNQFGQGWLAHELYNGNRSEDVFRNYTNV